MQRFVARVALSALVLVLPLAGAAFAAADLGTVVDEYFRLHPERG